MPSFKSINNSSLPRKKYWDNFTPISCKRLRVGNTSVGIGLIELTEAFDYKWFFRHCILQTILHVFLLFIFVWNKVFCSKNWVVFYIFLIWFGLAFGFTVVKVLCFWCPFYVKGNQVLATADKFNLLEITLKTVL